MARLARVEVFAPDEVAVVHVMNRVVRRCFLLGTDPFSGKNYDHRKEWIERQLERLSACFGIDLLGFAILSNHFHLILRSRPDVVATWSDTEVARRWLLLCPARKDAEGNPQEPGESELNMLRNDKRKLETIRLRLSDLGWWMRLLCQNIATRANKEDKESGKFWQSRFRAVRLLDEAAMLACAAYVDLNPIRAGLAKSLERSDFTSIQRRIQAEQGAMEKTSVQPTADSTAKAGAVHRAKSAPPSQVDASQGGVDRILAPLTLAERSGKPGPAASKTGHRCSDKGFLPITLSRYREILNWTARQLPRLKAGRRLQQAPEVIGALSISPMAWCQLIQRFGKLFYHVAGDPKLVDQSRSRVGQTRYYVRREVRELFTTLQ